MLMCACTWPSFLQKPKSHILKLKIGWHFSLVLSSKAKKCMPFLFLYFFVVGTVVTEIYDRIQCIKPDQFLAWNRIIVFTNCDLSFNITQFWAILLYQNITLPVTHAWPTSFCRHKYCWGNQLSQIKSLIFLDAPSAFFVMWIWF